MKRILVFLLLLASPAAAQQMVSVPVPVTVKAPSNCTSTTAISNGGIVVTVTCTCIPPFTITSPVSLPAAKVGVVYSADLSVLAQPTGGVAPYTFKAVSGLPAGLTLSSSGLISGTPTVSGSFTISFSVADSSTLAAKSSGVQINVEKVPQGSTPPIVPVIVNTGR